MLEQNTPKNEVTVEHFWSGCPIDGRTDKHTHTSEEWQKVMEEGQD